MRKIDFFRPVAAACAVCVAGFIMGACEDPFPDDNHEIERICVSGAESCEEACGSQECTADVGAGCPTVAVVYDDRQSCEDGGLALGTALEVGCGEAFGVQAGKFVACCCEV